MALRLAEVEPRDYTYIITPTGDELPPMIAHWAKLESLLGKPLIRITNGGRTLNDFIQIQKMLPNFQSRWCTRQLKIEPTIAWIMRNSPAVMYVGLRADEEDREGIYDSRITSDYPLRRWGWGIKEVWNFLADRDIDIPKRTDCARCYGQRLGEWKDLWLNYPDLYEEAAAQERELGHTFRSPSRDTWPAGLDDLAKEFASGRKVRGEGKVSPCRVCTL
jgi:3'-phosphoadenosine 5'-phosphosulfate sulfotransferase (PAPS reductase)/FAD synthetase